MELVVVNQPLCGPETVFGAQLKAELAAGPQVFRECSMLVAYAKLSGVLRTRNAIENFRNGGGRVVAVVGLDQHNTTREALELLMQICDEVFVYHDEDEFRTWHPKVYLFRGEQRAVVFVGSANLTLGGLYTNYEVILRINLDLTSERDVQVLHEFQAVVAAYSDINSPLCQRLDPPFLERLSAAGYVPTEDVARRIRVTDRAGGRSGRLFDTGRFPAPPPPDAEPPAEAQGEVEAEGEDQEPVGFWKRLSGNDVSLRGSPGQIIIPRPFWDLFPSRVQTKEPDPGGKGRQWECTFSVRYRDGNTVRDILTVRFITYEPRTGHARPNTESRFTFRNREVLETLREDDILVFRRARPGPFWFEVERIPATDAQQSGYTSPRRYGFL